ncbi:MAG: ubiquinone biosynthesis protein UbiE [Marinilabiliales bacterium]|nr:MAG: ubiquinone biosynthesis protein UbiE [Marinilabiliales bacterium]
MVNVFEKVELANSYDSYYETEQGKTIDRIEKELIGKILKNAKSDEMLELGCGTGHWTEFFEEIGYNITALDISVPMLEIAKKKDLMAKFIHGNSEQLPFEDQTFNIVASITMIEFVSNQEKVIHEMFRVLKPGGLLVLGCLNADSVMGKTKELSETFRNAKFLNPAEIEKLLIPYGKPEFFYGVYMNDQFEITDGRAQSSEPSFIAVKTTKI